MNTSLTRLNRIGLSGSDVIFLFCSSKHVNLERERFPGVSIQCTYNVPHTAPLGVIIEYVVLGQVAVGRACQRKGRGWLVIPLDPPLHHLLLYPLHLKHTNTDRGYQKLSWHQVIPHSSRTTSHMVQSVNGLNFFKVPLKFCVQGNTVYR